MEIKVQDIILWILFIISLVIAIWYIFGNSPTFEQTILILILTILFTTNSKVNNINSRLFLLERSFSALAKDFKHQITHK